MIRVVTGHKDGKSVFVSEGTPPRIVRLEYDGAEFIEMWATDEEPVIPVGPGDPTVDMSSFVPGLGGTRFRLCKMPPQQKLIQAFESGINPADILKDIQEKLPGLAEAMEPENPGMHTTDTIDYGIILSGEISLELDDGIKVHLKPGDCVVQNGTRHAWRNLGSEDCIIAFIMFGAKRK